MKTANLKFKKNSSSFLNVYDILIISLIAFTIILAIGIWIWYGHKEAQIENQLLHLK